MGWGVEVVFSFFGGGCSGAGWVGGGGVDGHII